METRKIVANRFAGVTATADTNVKVELWVKAKRAQEVTSALAWHREVVLARVALRANGGSLAALHSYDREESAAYARVAIWAGLRIPCTD